jgi:hypothetical protein
MNKVVLSVVFALVLITAIGMVSAGAVPVGGKTIVNGAVYQMDGSVVNEVPNADVSVLCLGNELNTTSVSDGSYYVVYNNTGLCGAGSFFEVWAYKDGLSGYNNGTIDQNGIPVCDNGCKVYLGHADVWLQIPEYGFVAAIVAILGAMAVFYFVRKN